MSVEVARSSAPTPLHCFFNWFRLKCLFVLSLNRQLWIIQSCSSFWFVTVTAFVKVSPVWQAGCAQVCTVSHMFAQQSYVFRQPCTLWSFPGSSKHRWRNMQGGEDVCRITEWGRSFFHRLTSPESISPYFVFSRMHTVACCLSSYRSGLDANLAVQFLCCLTQLVWEMIPKEINEMALKYLWSGR